MNKQIKHILEHVGNALFFNDCTITTAPRGSVYAAGASEIVITHTPTGETVKLSELTPETLREVLK